jgi:hypothetical protein
MAAGITVVVVSFKVKEMRECLDRFDRKYTRTLSMSSVTNIQ